jgi:hypothetical protein
MYFTHFLLIKLIHLFDKPSTRFWICVVTAALYLRVFDQLGMEQRSPLQITGWIEFIVFIQFCDSLVFQDTNHLNTWHASSEVLSKFHYTHVTFFSDHCFPSSFAYHLALLDWLIHFFANLFQLDHWVFQNPSQP